MQQSEQKLLNGSRNWRLFYDLRIRPLLLLVFGLLSLISILAISWNAFQVFNQYNDAEQMAGSNAIGQQALALNALLARERGLTAALISNIDNNTAQTQQHLTQLRKESDQGLQKLYSKLIEHQKLARAPIVLESLEITSQRLAEMRQQVDLSLKTQQNTISYEEWITEITQRIEEIAMINRIIMAPVKEEEHATRYGMFIKEAFFTFSENAGQERALISAVIAQNRPFSPLEIQQLDIYQHTAQLINKRLDLVLDFFPKTPEITLSQAELKSSYKQDYHALRSAVIASSQSKQPYPVNETQWFERATEAVNAILNLSHALDKHINEDIDFIKTRARNTVIALFATMILVVIVFIGAFMVTYRRILLPLSELEYSANTIARGNFSQAIQVVANDEFGDVAQAFEVMRNYLFDDRERRQKAEDELRKLTTAIEQSVSSIIITDTNGITEYVNPQFHTTTGYEADEVIGKKFTLLKSDETSDTVYADLWNTIKQGSVWQGELLNKKKNGDLYWEMVSISPVRNRHGKVAHYIGIQHDITERKMLEERLNFMAYHDELTKLPNRALLEDRFIQLVTHARRFKNRVALLILDLDRFKLINDSLGHRIGDQILIEVARRLKCTARSCDTIARYGGDEFVIIANGFSKVDALIDLAKRLIDTFTDTMTVEDHQLHVSASIGISIWPDDGEDMDTLLRHADSAMYHAKDLGRGQFQFFTDELNLKTSQRLRLENDLRDAINKQQLELYYQPQIHLASGKIIGCEALIRWNHPEIGLVSPIHFIPLAEETNLIRPIGEWVLQTACAQAVQWKEQGYEDLSMAVNVSVRQLDDPDFITCLTRILQESSLNPASLEIEITESTVMNQPEKMLDILNNIKQLGAKLALDDFGTGYSSLSYLRRFPFDKLKIDRSFIKDITHKPEDAAIAQSIGEMAHSLNMTVLAEGVETDIQAAYMRRSSCDEIQGYLISPPVPVIEFEQLLKKPELYINRINDKPEQPTILIVDDEPNIRQAIRRAIKQPWLNILEADDGYAALDILAAQSVQVIIADYHIPGIDGIDLLNRIKDLYPEIMRIAISGTVHKETIVKAINQGAVHRFLLKPWDNNELKSIVLDSFRQHTG